MSKRRRFVLSSLILSAGLLVIGQLVDLTTRYLGIGFLSLISVGLSVWSLKEGLDNLIEWLIIPALPFLYTLSVALFYFLLPANFFTLVMISLGFAFGMYILLLTENIFSVAAIRTIALFRAASSVAFLLTLITSFFLFDVIFSFRLSFLLNGFLAFGASLVLFIQSLWSVKLEKEIDKKILFSSLVLSFVLGQFTLAISFWPVSVALASLFLTACFYVLLGLSQAEFSGRLFSKTVREYLAVGIGVFITLLLTTKWGG